MLGKPKQSIYIQEDICCAAACYLPYIERREQAERRPHETYTEHKKTFHPLLLPSHIPVVGEVVSPRQMQVIKVVVVGRQVELGQAGSGSLAERSLFALPYFSLFMSV